MPEKSKSKRPTRDTNYSKVRVLINHDAQCLTVGDMIESFVEKGVWLTVTSAKFRRGGGGGAIVLENGYSFDPSSRNPRLRNMEIHRPMAKFRPSSFIPIGAKHEDNEGVPIKVVK